MHTALKNQIKARLEQKASWPEIQTIIHKLSQKGHKTFLAGGAIRDALLNKAPKDIDLVTSAPPKKLLQLFPSAKANWIKYGLIFIPLKTKELLEIAHFRKDSPYKDGRRPLSTSYGSIKQDALRRDFTINGLFYDFKTKQLIDHVGGLKDLQNKNLRAIGPAKKRFQEDYLRPLRALRLAHQLDFRIENNTAKAIPLFAENIKILSQQRIRSELEKLLSCGKWPKALKSLKQHKLFASVLPFLAQHKDNLKTPNRFWAYGFSYLKEPAFVWTALALPYFYSDTLQLKLFFNSLKLPKKTAKQGLLYGQGTHILTSKTSLSDKMLALNGHKQRLYELSLSWLKSQNQKTKALNKALKEFEKQENKGHLPPALVSGLDLKKLIPKPSQLKFSALLKQAYKYQISRPKASKSQILKHIHKS